MTIDTTERIKKLSKDRTKRLVEIRREIHMNPELGFEEFKTSKLVSDTLQELGIEVKTGIATTGVVGLIRGAKCGRTIAIRADMDALPIQEENELNYKSKNNGKMHACGHDVHTTLALGTAMILSQMKNQINGNVKFIFQPAEETTGGAKPMIEEGALDAPKVDAIIGGHVWSDIPSGKIGVKKGPIMGSVDVFELNIIGKGGHAAKPNEAIDPILIGSEVVCSLQKIVSRMIDPLDSVVLSICSFQAGNTTNIIPNNAIIKGTVRTLDDKVRKQIPIIMEDIIRGITESYKAAYEFKYVNGFPVTSNDDYMTDFIKSSAIKIIGKENIIDVERPSLGGEDFSYFLNKVPGTFIWIGVRNEDDGIIYDIHHPRFNIDENIIESTIAIYAQTIIDYLNV